MVPSGRRGGLLGPLAEAATVAALNRYAWDGRSLLLTGVAAGLVAPLGIDSLRTSPLVFGHYAPKRDWCRSPRRIRHSTGSTWTATCSG